MKLFLDTEFIEYPATIDLVSISLVGDNGREYYAISEEFDATKANDFVRNNVLTRLEPREGEGASLWKPRQVIRDEILEFVRQGQETENARSRKPVFWSYYADHHWAAFCWLFGSMVDLPEGYPMYCRDLKQWCDQLGNPKLPPKDQGVNHTLVDARWNKRAWEFLQGFQQYQVDIGTSALRGVFNYLFSTGSV